jgi:hypothetical protein
VKNLKRAEGWLPLPIKNKEIVIKRLEEEDLSEDFKDPCYIKTDKSEILYISNNKGVGLLSMEKNGVWQERNVVIEGIKGQGVCAPAVNWDQKTKKFTMYIQNEYARAGGHIFRATSSDGRKFKATKIPFIDYRQLRGVVGIYDAGIDNNWLTFSGYEKFPQKGDGQIWLGEIKNRRLTYARLILKRSEVPYQNCDDDYEWGLEGAKVFKITSGLYGLVGVCFTKHENYGCRQRLFLALSSDPYGPFGSFVLPFNPTWGENGHGDVVIEGNILKLFYQKRSSCQHPWKIAWAEYDLREIHP